jgi:site-specific DNA-methyltransferase (adenine-specific)
MLQHTDCLDFLPTVASKSVDLVLIDPPYVISRETGFQKGNDPAYDRLKVSMEFGEWDKPVDGMDQVYRELYRVLKRGGTLISFWDLWKITPLAEMMEAAGFKQLRFIEWVKTNPVPLNQSSNYLTNAREIALTGVKSGKPTFHSKYDKGIYEFPIEHGSDRWHPTQKSLGLFRDLIEKHSNPGDLVLDCFAGSCTTGVAALQTGRRFVGCEADLTYWEKAARRLEKQCHEQV